MFNYEINRFLIDNNSIGDEGAIALAGAIAGHPSLTDLRICNL